MKHLFTRVGREILRERIKQAPLLGFDFDGTLAPIVDNPIRAEMRTRTRALLHKVAARFRCVVLSGRSRQDVGRRLAGIPLWEVFGNHGLEPWHDSEALVERVKEWKTRLTSLTDRPGVWIEDKEYSLSIHYRSCANPNLFRREILEALLRLKEARIVSGKFVYNVLPDELVNKGTAFGEAMRRCQTETAIYVGDDDTDEDVFSCCDSARVLSIHVGRGRTSRAVYYLRHQEEIDELLAVIAGT